jgi:hypothetical protein
LIFDVISRPVDYYSISSTAAFSLALPSFFVSQVKAAKCFSWQRIEVNSIAEDLQLFLMQV